jgi:hypothetical protein
VAALDAATCGCVRGSYKLGVFSERVSFASASSAQFMTAAVEGVGGEVSFAGVAEPEDGLLGVAEEDGPVDSPFAAWA